MSNRQFYLVRTVPIALLAAAAALHAPQGQLWAETSGADGLIAGTERRYNRAQTLSVDFTETYSLGGHAHRPETGQLLLRKPGKMRWTYTDPAGKTFVSDGRNVYLYTAADNRVERSTLKGTGDMRAPLAFLLGKLDLKKEFRHFETKAAPGGTYLVAESKSDRVPYTGVSMLIGPGSEIRGMTVTGRDGSELGFVFRNEILNPALPLGTFRFTIPSGAEVVDAIESGSGEN